MLPEPLMYEGPSATGRLAQIGLSEDWLLKAVRAAQMEKANTTALEPTIAGGIKAWFAAHRAFGEEANPSGWTKTEERNLPRWVNPEGTAAIAIIQGNENTGRQDRTPKSKSPRGIQSAFLVEENRRQGELFANDARFLDALNADGTITWWLLMFLDGDELRAELSLATEMDDEQRLTAWQERIILDFTDQDLVRESGATEPDVPVRPRRA